MNRIQERKITKLASRINKLQEKVDTEAINLDKQLKRRVEDDEDFLYDYEINIIIYFYKSIDDIEWDEDKDNILVVLTDYVKNISCEEKRNRFSSRKHNYNESYGFKFHLKKDEFHCWWFYCLHSHTHLEYEDLLRIGDIGFDIEVRYQYLDEV
jgi:hypothetical protein